MIDSLLLFGATGDLAGRLLFPALVRLLEAGHLPDTFRITATSRRDWDSDRFREHMAERLDRHAQEVPLASRKALVAATTHHYSDVSDQESMRRVVQEAAGPKNRRIAAYLALPQSQFIPFAETLGAVDMPTGSRLVVEKPIGENLRDAQELNAALNEVAGSMGSESVYRVDHVLGMAPLQNLMGLRFANPVLATIWSSEFIEQIDVLWEETLALEGRAGFYDNAGALRDVLQNHMIQILCYAAMKEPQSLSASDVQDAKVALLNSVRPLTGEDMRSATRRARYTAGTLAVSDDSAGTPVPDYVAEDGVDPNRDTETFAEIVLHIDNERWDGTRFVLRTGKALAERRKEVVVHFRREAMALFGSGDPLAGELRIGIDGPMETRWTLNGAGDTSPARLRPMELVSAPVESDLPPYAWVLLDILQGGSNRSVRGDEAEAAWKVVMPVLDAWAQGKVPMDEYPAGSEGPPRLFKTGHGG